MAKAVFMGKFTALCQYIRNKQSSPGNDFWIHIKKLEEKEKIKHKISLKKENESDINKIENKNNRDNNEIKIWVFEKINKIAISY